MKVTKPSDKTLYRLLFFLSSFLFISFVVIEDVFGQISLLAEISGLVASGSFVTYALLYLLNFEKKVLEKLTKNALLITFCISLANLIMLPILASPLGITMVAHFLTSYEYIGLFIVLVLPLFFLIFFGIWLFNQGYKKISYSLLAISVALIAFYFVSGLIFSHYKINDEIFILLLETKALLAGANPYAVSVSQQLFYNVTGGIVNTPSVTSQNTVVGTLSYPALYILSFVPFYIFSDGSLQGLIAGGLKVQEALFLLVALITTALVIDKRLLGKPVYSLILFTTIALSYLSSIAIYLMFALLLLAYAKLESRYSWIFLGLCTSLQQQLWFPVILLIIYSFSNQGVKAGMRNIFGSLAIFLLINAYFIALNPTAFFGNLFGTVSGILLPVSFSSVGYLLVTNYPILLSGYSALFLISVAILSLLFLYFNEKRLVGLFAMIPFLFNSHSIPVYYTFFTGFLIVTIFIKNPKGKASAKKYLAANMRLLYASLLALALAATFVVYSSHAAYGQGFGALITNSSIRFDSATNQTIYSGDLSYSGGSLYVLAVVSSKYDVGYEGLLNHTIITQAISNCTQYPCIVNVNRLVISHEGNYPLTLHLGRGTYSEPIYGVRVVLYNDNYFYISDAIFNQTILDSFSK